MASAVASALSLAFPYLADALVILGLWVMTVGVYGVIRMPDTYTRLHAASKAVFLGVISFCASSAVTGEPAIIYRAFLIAAFLLVTTPTGSEDEGRLGHRERRVASPYLGKLPRALRSSSKAVSSLPFLEIRENLSRTGFASENEPLSVTPIGMLMPILLGVLGWRTRSRLSMISFAARRAPPLRVGGRVLRSGQFPPR